MPIEDIQTAIVTGAGRGIGRACSVALAKHGVKNLLLTARTQHELEETASLCKQYQCHIICLSMNIADDDAPDILVATALSRFGQIDLLVNNAGVAHFAPLVETSDELFDDHYMVNLRAPFRLSREVIKHMMPRKQGAIMNIASSASLKPYKNQGSYAASKYALLGMTQSWAIELRPYRIKMSCICPGGVDTRLSDESHANRDKTGWIQPEDIADGLIYWLQQPINITTDVITIRRFDSEPLC
ncbi:MAG: SDR family oxidoreductase [Armatimonadota bacterium]